MHRREDITLEEEKEIKKLKSIKNFAEKHKDNEEFMSSYLASIEPGQQLAGAERMEIDSELSNQKQKSKSRLAQAFCATIYRRCLNIRGIAFLNTCLNRRKEVNGTKIMLNKANASRMCT